MMKTLLEQTAEKMVASLKEYAETKGVSVEQIRELFKTQDTKGLNALDELFEDGGMGRYDYFSIYSHDYAEDFTDDVQSDEYDEKRWEVELKAMREF